MRILVTGAGGLLGELTAARCEAAGREVLRAGRRARETGWLAWDMSGGPPAETGPVDAVLHTAPIWLLPDQIQHLSRAGARRLVCFGSTSVATKRASASRPERALAERLADAERRLWSQAERCGMPATVLRPSMIYGHGRDRNVSAIAAFIRRYGFFAVAGRAHGARQPVYAGDLATAALAALDAESTRERTYDLAGGETLSYRAMVARIFEALHKPARIVTLPVGLYRFLLAVAARAGRSVTGSMAVRMNQDLVFDIDAARRDFGFDPEAFLTHPERDLFPA